MPTTPSAGLRLGPYELVVRIGQGGMGEVWRARDTRLNREVAIKTSAEQFTDRFGKEAHAIAALNHPNICTLFDVGPDYLVMELIDGHTLQDRIKDGPIPLDEALAIARHIADALEAAHERNIVHRDLKPGNIKVNTNGSVKVLDFGLAKTSLPQAQVTSDSPTLLHAPTQAGIILGTAAYMAPEQARGKIVDKRADIWSFGVVLLEMVTGKSPFQGTDLTDTLASVVKSDPDLTAVPKKIRTLIAKCLEKDPRNRLRDIGDAWTLLDSDTPTEPRPSGSGFLWPAVAAVCALAAIAALIFRAPFSSSADRLTAANLTMDLAPAEMLGGIGGNNLPSRTAMAISPDGATVVFVGRANGISILYRRPFAASAAAVMPGTENAEYPFFSPDGKWVAFSTPTKLRKIALSGGPPIDICDLASPTTGASWGPAGVIVFGGRGLWTVADSGGKPAVLVEANPTAGLYSPQMLPDGKTVIFIERHSSYDWEKATIEAIRIDNRQRKTLLTNAADAHYSPTGHLVFMRNGSLLAVAFDARHAEVSGSPVPLLSGVAQSVNSVNSLFETGMGQYAVSGAGTLLYASGGIFPDPATSLVRLARNGTETRVAEIQGAVYGLRLSPDGSKVVGDITNKGSRASDLWSWQLSSGAPVRLTNTGDALWPVFSPDGKSIASLQGSSTGNAGIYLQSTDGAGTPTRVSGPAGAGYPASWSRDGNWLTYTEAPLGVYQLFVIPMRSPGKPIPFASSKSAVVGGEFSPDSHWIAYSSDESGASEVYVEAFPGPGEKHRISVNGGRNPAWGPNGRELYYLHVNGAAAPLPDSELMAADISTAAGGFRAGTPHTLFHGPYTYSGPGRSYDVTADGQFIMVRRNDGQDLRITHLNVVMGWGEELKRKVPGGTPSR